MRLFAFMSSLCAVALSVVAAQGAAMAQLRDGFEKTYPVTGRPHLQVTSDSASIEARACDRCNAVRVQIHLNGQDASRFHLYESQAGNAITISLKQKEDHSWSWNGNRKSPAITIELPAGSDAKLHSSNGDVQLAGVQGDLDLGTSNGNINVDHVSGALRLDTNNGAVTFHDVHGTLHASSSNGNIRGDGQITKVEARTSNGVIDLGMPSGTQLASDSTLSTSNGEVTLRVPRDLHANVHMHSSSGSVHSDFPLRGGDDSDRHALDGPINGGGPNLEMTSSNGSVRIVGN